MPRYGKLGIRRGKVTEAYGRKWNTDGPGFIEGELHALDTPFYGGIFTEDEYKIRVIL